MKLILSDRPIKVLEAKCNGITKYFDLSQLNIAGCLGCFGCWIKTPGRCVIRDDAASVYPYIAQSDRLLYISKVKYGSYDTTLKRMLERAIPIQQAYIRLFHGEAHHVQRNVVPKKAVILAYGEIDDGEKEVFQRLIVRNAYNMSFESYEVRFVGEDELEEAVRKEVADWEE